MSYTYLYKMYTSVPDPVVKKSVSGAVLIIAKLAIKKISRLAVGNEHLETALASPLQIHKFWIETLSKRPVPNNGLPTE